MKKILCICLSSTLQRTIDFEELTLAQVNRSKKYRQDASGKAINSARVLNQLEKGCAVCICPLGEKNQQYFLDLAAQDDLEIRSVTIPGFTRECWTLLDKFRGTTTELVVSEPALEIKAESGEKPAEIKLLKMINEAFSTVDAVLLAGSRPAVWSTDLYATIAGMAKDAGKLFLADYIGADMEKTLESAIPDIIKINEEEFIATFMKKRNKGDSPRCSSDDLKTAISEKSKELKNIIIVTRGAESTFAAKNGEFTECPCEKVNAVNTTACGDSFNAGFIYEYINTNDFKSALKKGTWCAARNAELEVPGGIK